jgi:hypothetical protein
MLRSKFLLLFVQEKLLQLLPHFFTSHATRQLLRRAQRPYESADSGCIVNAKRLRRRWRVTTEFIACAHPTLQL